MTDSSEERDAPRYKVGKVIERYSLDGMGSELEARWLGDGRDSHSLRELATYFNEEVVRSAIADTDRREVSGDVENLYQVLTDDDVSRAEQTRVRKELERDGIDVEQLEQDFVTHQAVHTYLTKGREVAKETEPEDRLDNARQTINRLRSRLIAVSETTLDSLRQAGAITLGSYDIFVEISVHCTDCGTHKNFFEVLTDRGCECSDQE
ncbi:rod-determining factor RdfA [Halorientalis brevis]|uniref:Rod-determining factor RdfA n=1 Tax=Halorientalis brevis TaxID=1126241 RepID=A0ABD6CGD5_9EURY|nr:rod-determining factor RdfA [Halorientalis brevis]